MTSATVQNSQATGASSSTAAGMGSSSNAINGGVGASAQAGSSAAGQQPNSSTPAHLSRPRDSRIIELLLTSQGVNSFDHRVPLLLLDFAYRHTSAILQDAIHLTTDPYVSHAGAKPSGSSGAAPSAPSASDANVTTSAINLAIASRQAFQFRGGAGGGAGGASKDWLQDLARERNKIALPRVLANEWGVRLPNERFVHSGMGWDLKDHWEAEMDEDESDENDDDIMEDDGINPRKHTITETSQTGEEGGLDELLGDDMVDQDMDEME